MAEPPKLYPNGLSNDEFHSLYPSITKDLLGTLRQRSISAKTHAYCPYSNFRVGATLVTIQGEYFDGANIENAAYPVGICAERTALGTAIFTLSRKNCRDRGGGRCDDQSHHGEGNKKRPENFNFTALAIATDGENPASPCGMCRQFVKVSRNVYLAQNLKIKNLLNRFSNFDRYDISVVAHVLWTSGSQIGRIS
ncbi:hypothetical protein Golomagni_02445 [Golovinomyces magnicellulatus]|nr:hypothetical protein Golomagni_02445 [Golovinomyces magnicellulatus]